MPAKRQPRQPAKTCKPVRMLAAAVRPTEAETIAKSIVECLFTSGHRVAADRLVLWDDSKRMDLGGWCRGAVERVIRNHLERKASRG